MAFFQNSVLNKHLKGQDAKTVNVAYQKFTAYFHNPTIQQNIRDAKEEQFQEGFLRELFVQILGYTLNPHPNFNLTTELKNEKGAKKADGAILQNGKALGVIELKGTDTKDLDKINVQAFNYKNNQTGCVYVITSNFEKLRFFIHNSVDHIEFNLFTLTETEFQLLWLCLSAESLFKGTPLKAKEESLLEEEKITKQLYKDYSAFRTALWQNMVKNSPEADRLLLFKKTQKLLDRYLFIFFAEDSGLLPPNSIFRIIKRWELLKQEDAYKPLYEIFNQYFGYINTGRKGQNSIDDIFAYNGGLFLPDEVLDTIILDDEILYPHVMQLTNYDFQSEVDVNILGHIFENSLNEIENITAELEGQEIDKSKTKRKKDGVFYTPKYITKYIVDNTVGKLCAEKKAELKIIDEEYTKNRKGRTTVKLKELRDQLEDYRQWLLQITICDPACGSGAFLNQALDFLIKEHQYIDELQTSLLGGGFVFPDIENTVLENNIFGVDLNEESVEIAKLSLWLRTAQPRRKLNDLSSNIKCGNSLIDSKAVVGDKAFKWEDEFPHVFAKGGFDVVIGNPPYGAELNESCVKFIEKNYKSFEYQVNSYVIFYEKGIDILKTNGILGYITPATFTYQHYFKNIREIFNNLTILSVAKYFYEVFEDADIGDSVSWIVKKSENKNRKIEVVKCLKKINALNLITSLINYSDVVNKDGTYNLNESNLDIQKIISKGLKLGDLCQIVVGIKPYQTNKGKPKQTREIVSSKIFTSNYKKDDSYINCVIGKDFHRYKFLQEPEMYISYGEWLAEPRQIAPFFDNEKIILRQTADSLIGTIDNKQRVNLNNVYNVGRPVKNVSLYYLLGLLNSKLLNVIYQSISQEKGRLFAEVKKVNLAKLPIMTNENLNTIIDNRVKSIIDFNNELSLITNKFSKYLLSHFNSIEINKKLQNWFSLEFGEFIIELNKAIKTSGGTPLTKLQEMEWMEVFETKKAEAQILKTEIDKTDKEIDQLVYELYGLTEEEIKIVEGS